MPPAGGREKSNPMTPRGDDKAPIKVGLFVTCLVDLMRPSVGFAAVRLLEDAGCRVDVPGSQTCCGQPAYNAGDRRDATAVARQVVDVFESYDYVVAPSASCAAMISRHYPALLENDGAYGKRARELAARTYELTAFLADVGQAPPPVSRWDGSVVFQDSCSALRELGVRDQPRALLRRIDGLELRELSDGENCCGFGGLFCVKYAEISTEMVSRKADDIITVAAATVTGVDLGCLLNIAGRLKRVGSDIETRHVAEVLAGETRLPAIAAGSRK